MNIKKLFVMLLAASTALSVAGCGESKPSALVTPKAENTPIVYTKSTPTPTLSAMPAEQDPGSSAVTIDDQGMAHWASVSGAVIYDIYYICETNSGPTCVHTASTEDTSIKVPEGYRIDVFPTTADGTSANTLSSDYYYPNGYVLPDGSEFDHPGSANFASQPIKIQIDETGIAIWNAVENATDYDVLFIYEDEYPIAKKMKNTSKTHIRVTEGYYISVTAHLSDGSSVGPCYSDYYYPNGPTLPPEILEQKKWELPGNPLDIEGSEFMVWDVVSNYIPGSFKKLDEHTVSFEAKGPDGKTVRFWGEDIEVSEKGIYLPSTGRLMSLDSIGRIYSIEPVLASRTKNTFSPGVFGGYNIDEDPHPGTLDRMIFTSFSLTLYDETMFNNTGAVPKRGFRFNYLQPNFGGIGFGTPMHDRYQFAYDNEPVTLTALYYTYLPSSECTHIRALYLNEDFYSAYLEGEYYNEAAELYDPEHNQYTFQLFALPELEHIKTPVSDEVFLKSMEGLLEASYNNYFKILGLKSPDGSSLPKAKTRIQPGTTITVQLGCNKYDVPLTVTKVHTTATSMHELVPYAYPSAVGDLNPLVIPIKWLDDDPAKADENYQIFKNNLGRVFDISGNVTDHSSALKDRFSLSSYFDIASYGKLNINSFITDWYPAPYTFAEYYKSNVSSDFIADVEDWLFETYPDMDWSKFDLDGNGYFDSGIFLNAGPANKGAYTIISFEGAINYQVSYGGDHKGTADRPAFNCLVNMNAAHLDNNTLLHEFSHGLGLIDYYDVTYTGADPIGSYDLQAMNVGDWNAYSKYSVNWIEPTLVTGLKPGEHKDITIGAFPATGDAIVIPPAGNDADSPFREYMLVDLFTATGVNKYDAADSLYNLQDAVGVRIYHVDAVMEYRDYKDKYPIGTIHFSNAYSPDGRYNIELIQAGAKNTLTDLSSLKYSPVSSDDFFKAGDKFTLSKYSEFFHEGLMDYGDDLGYSIEVISITGKGEDAKAVIRITRE